MAKPGKTLVMVFLCKSGKHYAEISNILPGKQHINKLVQKLKNT